MLFSTKYVEHIVIGNFFKRAAWQRLLFLGTVLWFGSQSTAWAQTPSPLQEWQYSSGVDLQRLFQPNMSNWSYVLGAAYDYRPMYDGASLTRTQAGPVIRVRYQDLAFVSIGEGAGINFLRDEHYHVGVALTYDLGRLVQNDVGHLHGLGNIDRAPVVKLYGSYVISKSFPLVLRADMRQIVGGADGMVGDIEAYMPLPGSSKRLVMFAGPSYTYADHLYLQKVFGVDGTQSMLSGLRQYNSHSGSDAAGFGFSATGFITDHWLMNLDAAVNRLLGSAEASPITQKTTQRVAAFSIAYKW